MYKLTIFFLPKNIILTLFF